ncbi:MAG: putative LmbE-like protein [Acidimicrobiaceae bacterium]|jgi:LmbE family N-acetylglucosaminyl deacetylase|nr:putative LmbE-like protein [Acidimicrobiaceae bacterium]
MPVAPELVADVPGRALAIYAHPDDADVSCGGTLARWAASGCEVHLVVCAKGDKGSSEPGADVPALVEARAAEVAAAALELGVARVHRLGVDDGELENDHKLRCELVRLIRDVRPDAVVCPDPTAVFFGEHYYNHRDHRIVGWAVLDSVSPAAASPLYFPTSGPAWTVGVVYLSASLDANVVVDITSVIDRKAAAILCHRSQLGESGEWLGVAMRERAEQAGRLGGVSFAEAFRRVRLGQ